MRAGSGEPELGEGSRRLPESSGAGEVGRGRSQNRVVGGASKGPKAGPYKGRGLLRKGGAPPTGEELRRKGRGLEWGRGLPRGGA